MLVLQVKHSRFAGAAFAASGVGALRVGWDEEFHNDWRCSGYVCLIASMLSPSIILFAVVIFIVFPFPSLVSGSGIGRVPSSLPERLGEFSAFSLSLVGTYYYTPIMGRHAKE